MLTECRVVGDLSAGREFGATLDVHIIGLVGGVQHEPGMIPSVSGRRTVSHLRVTFTTFTEVKDTIEFPAKGGGVVTIRSWLSCRGSAPDDVDQLTTLHFSVDRAGGSDIREWNREPNIVSLGSVSTEHTCIHFQDAFGRIVRVSNNGDATVGRLIITTGDGDTSGAAGIEVVDRFPRRIGERSGQ